MYHEQLITRFQMLYFEKKKWNDFEHFTDFILKGRQCRFAFVCENLETTAICTAKRIKLLTLVNYCNNNNNTFCIL